MLLVMVAFHAFIIVIDNNGSYLAIISHVIFLHTDPVILILQVFYLRNFKSLTFVAGCSVARTMFTHSLSLQLVPYCKFIYLD